MLNAPTVVGTLRAPSREYRMNSESVAGVLGAIIAAAVLVVAIIYGPIGKTGNPQKQTPKIEQPVAAPPVVRGPVVREVPQ
jgi:hypothetical protein